MTAPRDAGRGPGLGDRWMAGEALAGVDFRQHDRVQVTHGPHTGRAGRVLLLAAPPPEPAYLVEVDGAARPVRVGQAALRPAS